MSNSEVKPSIFDIFTQEIRKKMRLTRPKQKETPAEVVADVPSIENTSIVPNSSKEGFLGEIRQKYESHVNLLKTAEESFVAGETTLAPDLQRSNDGFKNQLEKALDDKIKTLESGDQTASDTPIPAAEDSSTQAPPEVIEQKEITLEELLEKLKSEIVFATTDWFQWSHAVLHKNEQGVLEEIDYERRPKWASEYTHMLTSRENDQYNRLEEKYKDTAWRRYRSLFALPDLYERSPSGSYLNAKKDKLFVGVFKEKPGSPTTTIIMQGRIGKDTRNIVGMVAVKVQISSVEVVEEFLSWLNKSPQELLSRLATDVLKQKKFEGEYNGVIVSLRNEGQPIEVDIRTLDEQTSISQ